MNIFGSGNLWGTPLQDASGNALANPSPVLFGTLQEVSIDISFDTKMLYGQLQFPVDVARGKGKATGKAKAANINGALFNSIFFGQTMSSGILRDVYDVVGSVIPTTPFQVTPVVPNSGTWATDLGVRTVLGTPLVRVASAPTTGQYSVAAGVYTFASADVGLTFYISYQYTATSTSAQKSTVANLLMGQAPTFRADISVTRGAKALTVTLNNCIASKLAMVTKQDDFMIPEFDFDCFADANGNVLTYSTSE